MTETSGQGGERPWILVELSDPKRRQYFKRMSAIGPELTDNIGEAHQFHSRFEAVDSRAMRFTLTFFEVQQLPPTGGER